MVKLKVFVLSCISLQILVMSTQVTPRAIVDDCTSLRIRIVYTLHNMELCFSEWFYEWAGRSGTLFFHFWLIMTFCTWKTGLIYESSLGKHFNSPPLCVLGVGWAHWWKSTASSIREAIHYITESLQHLRKCPLLNRAPVRATWWRGNKL